MPKDLFDYDVFLSNAKQSQDAILAGTAEATRISQENADKNIGVFTSAASAASAAIAPYAAAGKKSLNELQNILGLNGADAQKASTARILNSPQVQQQIEQGSKAIGQSAAASGLLGSGRFLTDLQKFGQNTAVSEIDRNSQRLGGLANTGLQAATAEAQIQSNLGGNIVGQNSNAAQTAANGALANANARASLFNTQGQIDLQRQLDRYSFGAPGGFGGQPDLTGQSGGGSAFNPRNNVNASNGLSSGTAGQVGNQIFYGNGVQGQQGGTAGSILGVPDKSNPLSFGYEPPTGGA